MFRSRWRWAWAAVAVAGCASTTIDLPRPADASMSAGKGDYRLFVDAWMGALPRKAVGFAGETQPSDARLLPLGKFTPSVDQVKVLQDTFTRWCELSAGAARLRDADMASPGLAMIVCVPRSGPRPVAVMQVYPDTDASRQGRRELLIQHWYPPAIERYLAAAQERANRTDAKLAQLAQARQAQDARDQAAAEARAAERRARDRAEVERLARAAEGRAPPQCRRFERESNALRARFMGTVERAELGRHVSDLIVAYDECANARPTPSADLVGVYRFNLQSFQLFTDAWDANLLHCDARGVCRPAGNAATTSDPDALGRLQARYPDIGLSPPGNAEGILARVQRFALDR